MVLSVDFANARAGHRISGAEILYSPGKSLAEPQSVESSPGIALTVFRSYRLEVDDHPTHWSHVEANAGARCGCPVGPCRCKGEARARGARSQAGVKRLGWLGKCSWAVGGVAMADLLGRQVSLLCFLFFFFLFLFWFQVLNSNEVIQIPN